MGAFAYVPPPLPGYTTIYPCADLVIPMGWVNLPLFFCAAPETVADMANLYISDPSTSSNEYVPTFVSYSTLPSRKASPARLQGTYVYMDDLMCVVQGDPAQQSQVTKLVLREMKEILPTVSG